MTKYFKLITLLFLVLFLLTFPSKVQGRERRSVRVVTIPANEVVNQDLLLKSGEIVEISGTVNGDVYIAGGEISVDGSVNGDLLAVGGIIEITGEVTQDVRVAGGEIRINGKIGRNTTLVGGQIDITDGSELGGSLLITGGDVVISGHVPGELKVYAGNLTIDSKVSGKSEAYVGTARLTSKAQVNDFVYTSDQQAVLDKGASISGQLLKKVPPDALVFENIEKNFLNGFNRLRYQATIVSFIAALITGSVVLRFFPNQAISVTQVLEKKLWASLAVGFLAFILIPLVLILFFLSIVGLPLALILFFAYLTFIYLAKIFLSLWLGLKITRRINQKSLYITLLLGLLLYYLASLVPVFGVISAFLVHLMGLGAVFLAFRQYYRDLSKLKIAK